MRIQIHRTIAILSMGFFVVFAMASPSRGAGAAPATTAWHPDQFVISFWCSPPEKFVTVSRYRQIADAGFNYVMPICGPTKVELNKKMLEVAQATHLKVFIEDKRMPMSLPDAKARAMVDTIVADYSHYPSFAGYFLTDEPLPPVFKGLGQVVDYLRKKDPAHPVFINLLPGYPGGMINQAYDNYLNYFVSVVHPSFLSYDHYSFTKNGDAPWFLENLEAVARVSKSHGLPFFNIVLATQHLIYRRLTEAEKRYEAMQTLAYGAHGLLWFTYWQPDASGMWKDAIVNYDGKPTYQYPQIQRINHELAAFGNALLHAEWIHTWASRPPDKIVKFANPSARWTVGFFKQGSMRLLFIANQDYKNSVASDLHIQTGGSPLERFDPQRRKFLPDHTNHLELESAGAALYRWKFPE